MPQDVFQPSLIRAANLSHLICHFLSEPRYLSAKQTQEMGMLRGEASLSLTEAHHQGLTKQHASNLNNFYTMTWQLSIYQLASWLDNWRPEVTCTRSFQRTAKALDLDQLRKL